MRKTYDVLKERSYIRFLDPKYKRGNWYRRTNKELYELSRKKWLNL